MARDNDELTLGYLIAITYSLKSQPRSNGTQSTQTRRTPAELLQAHRTPTAARSETYDSPRGDWKVRR